MNIFFVVSSTHGLVADQNLSVMVIVNLANVKSRPELKFLGPERVVQPWFEKLGDKLEDWDEKKNFVQELLNILGETSDWGILFFIG